MASSTIVDPLILALKVQNVIVEDDEDEQDDLLDSYNEFLLEHIKSEKA